MNSPGPVVKCKNCGFFFINPIFNDRAIIREGSVLYNQPHEFLESNDLDYLEECWEKPHIYKFEAEYQSLIINHLDAISHINKYKNEPGRLLDFGCGGGFFLGTAKEKGWEIFGLEPLPGHAIYARVKFGANVITDTLRWDTFEKNFFDIVTAFQVFEHLSHPTLELEKIASFLKPGGIVLIEVPNIDSWSVRLLGHRHRHFVMDHLNFFSPFTLTRLFNNVGLEILEIYNPSRRMSINYFLKTWGRRIFPNKINQLFYSIAQALRLTNQTISINLGDIIIIIGRKPETNH